MTNPTDEAERAYRCAVCLKPINAGDTSACGNHSPYYVGRVIPGEAEQRFNQFAAFMKQNEELKSQLSERDAKIEKLYAEVAAIKKEYQDYKVHYDRIFEKSIVVEDREYAKMCDELSALRTVAHAARGIGMNWKTGAPYGGDALDDALRELDRVRRGE